jgi:hypothetical protein
MNLEIKGVSQIAQKWSDIIPAWGCNIECCRAIMMKILDKNISSKAFYNKLLKHGVVSEIASSYYGYILDYYKMFEIFGIMDMQYNREFKFDKEMIIELLEMGYPIKARVPTGKNKYHFMLIVGYDINTDCSGNIRFNIIDPMERDYYLDPKTWIFQNKDGKPTKRKLDRIEWFV